MAVRVPRVLRELIRNEALAGRSTDSEVVRKALRHYFNCRHVRRATHANPTARSPRRATHDDDNNGDTGR